ncbi:type II secretion system F family protein [Candidatus Magnetaquicoccus inordinatus]|uniref:type II secretion system F family protein n=1 Tax=Candidatus Magnetaquicoccus inordinatus TaxID=2496818 RepID=UPI00102B84E8|nr:type II secretion system F family protein [Candidatus Magnetaquicoccus inordinatus]
MNIYTYKGRNRQGKTVSGELTAASAEDAASQLLHRGIVPLSVKSQDRLFGLGKLEELLGGTPPKPEHIVLFCRQMQTLVRSRVPMNRAIRGVQGGVSNKMLYNALTQISDGLEAGKDLSACLADHPKMFSRLFVNMVKVGEQTGRLEEAFGQLYRYLELDYTTRKQIRSAMQYPLFILSGMGVAMFVMTYYVLPNFFEFFASLKMELPWQTRILINVSHFVVDYWYLLFLAASGLVWGFKNYVQTPEGELWWGGMKLQLPVVGSIIKRGTLARFARAFAMGIRSGVPILAVLESVSQAVDNRFVASKIREIMWSIERGETLVQATYATGIFPPLVVQMIAVGEETGSIEQTMTDVAQFYEQEVEYSVKNLSSAIEPLITVMMGLMVMVLAMGVFVPLWDMIRGASRQ